MPECGYHLFRHQPSSETGEEVFAKNFGLYFGGGVPGSLVNTQRLGIPSHTLTYLGSSHDIFTEFAKKALRDFRVGVVDLYRGDDIAVNVTSAMVCDNDRTFMSYGRIENGPLYTYPGLEESVIGKQICTCSIF